MRDFISSEDGDPNPEQACSRRRLAPRLMPVVPRTH
jgi:hypothetical protein